MRVYRIGQANSIRFLLCDASGPISGYNKPSSPNSIDQQNPDTLGTPLPLDTERIIEFTPGFTGLFLSFELYITTRGIGDGATLTVELQKYEGTVWQTIGSCTYPTGNLVEESWNLLQEFVKSDSFILTSEVGRWRIRLTENSATTPTYLATSDDTNISYRLHSASVHTVIGKVDFTSIGSASSIHYPPDIANCHPYEEDALFLSEEETGAENQPEKLDGIYLLNLSHGFTEVGEYVLKHTDERGKGRTIEQLRIVSGIIDGFSSFLVELEGIELLLSPDSLSGGELSVYRGDSALYTLTVIDRFGDPVDLTDASLYLTVKEKEDDTEELISVEAAIESPTEGRASFTLIPTMTDLTPGIYVADIELNLPSGEVKTLWKGRFNIKADVRR